MNRYAVIALATIAISAPALAAKGDADAGRTKAEACKACHGVAGMSAAPEFPRIAGQHADYLAAVLRHYKLGKRKNAIMSAQVANLSERDMLDLAAFYAAQAGLSTRY